MFNFICKSTSKSLFIKNNKYFCESFKKIETDFLKLDFYSVLNLKKNATETEIKKNYFILAKKFHPDKFKGPPEIFRKISDAYTILKDHSKREEYDKRMKLKMRKKYRESREHEKPKTDEEIRSTMQEFSKYEEDFKKLNIEKLFSQFLGRKIKTNPDEIKTYRSELEIKMSKREYKIQQFLKAINEQEMKNKNISYNFYKQMGILKEDTLKTNKTYQELVNKEIKNIKNKFTFKEEIKIEQKQEKEQEDTENRSIIKLIYFVFGFYLLVMSYVIYLKFKNYQNEQFMKREIMEKAKQKRFDSYLYVGKS